MAAGLLFEYSKLIRWSFYEDFRSTLPREQLTLLVGRCGTIPVKLLQGTLKDATQVWSWFVQCRLVDSQFIDNFFSFQLLIVSHSLASGGSGGQSP